MALYHVKNFHSFQLVLRSPPSAHNFEFFDLKIPFIFFIFYTFYIVTMLMMQIDSYSAFYDNGHISQTELHDLLTARNIGTLYIVGLATDYCVYYTALDASKLGLVSG